MVSDGTYWRHLYESASLQEWNISFLPEIRLCEIDKPKREAVWKVQFNFSEVSCT